MKAFKYFVIIVLSLIALLTVITLFLPDTISVEKSLIINAPAAEAYALAGDLKNIENLFPMLQIDKKMKKTLSTNTTESGASFEWRSDMKNVGSGNITIVEAKPGEYIKFAMTLDGTDAGFTEIRFETIDGKTKVTWSMNSDVSFIARWFVPSYEDMIGKDIDSSLASLKRIAELSPAGKLEISVKQFSGAYYLAIADSSNMDGQAIAAKYASAYQEIMAFMEKNKLQISGAPVSITNSFTPAFFTFNAAIPIAQPFIGKKTGRIISDSIPSCKVVVALHVGPYSAMMPTYDAIMKYITENKLEIAGRSWEEYIDDPMKVKPDELKTNIYFPVK